MNPDDVSSAILALITASTKHATEMASMATNNLTQGLGTIQNVLIQQNGGVSDDSGLIAALQTAAGVPKQGTTA